MITQEQRDIAKVIGPHQYTLDKAAAILAAGYRKPRTIMTVEELDALPIGSIIP